MRQKRFALDGEAVLLGVDGISDFDGLHTAKLNAFMNRQQNDQQPLAQFRWEVGPDQPQRLDRVHFFLFASIARPPTGPILGNMTEVEQAGGHRHDTQDAARIGAARDARPPDRAPTPSAASSRIAASGGISLTAIDRACSVRRRCRTGWTDEGRGTYGRPTH